MKAHVDALPEEERKNYEMQAVHMTSLSGSFYTKSRDMINGSNASDASFTMGDEKILKPSKTTFSEKPAIYRLEKRISRMKSKIFEIVWQN